MNRTIIIVIMDFLISSFLLFINADSNNNSSNVVENPFNEKNSWFAFNDSIISETSFENVVKSKPVFLIYRRND